MTPRRARWRRRPPPGVPVQADRLPDGRRLRWKHAHDRMPVGGLPAQVTVLYRGLVQGAHQRLDVGHPAISGTRSPDPPPPGDPPAPSMASFNVK